MQTHTGARMVEISKRDIWLPARVSSERPDLAHSLLAVDFMPPDVLNQLLQRVAVGVAAGKLQPLRTLCYSLHSAAAAMRVLAQAGHVGKVCGFNIRGLLTVYTVL